MSWEEKLVAMKELGDAHLCMREPGNWYVSHTCVEFKQGGFLTSPTQSSCTPQEAVEEYWNLLTTLQRASDKYEHIRVGRKKYQWLAHRWVEIA